MKKLFTTLLIGFLVSSFVLAQSFTITDTLGNDVTNSTISVEALDNASIVDYDFHITNISASDKTIKVKKTEVSIVSGTVNTFCWVNCYLPSTYTSTESFLIPSGYTTQGDENLICDYLPYGHTGVSTITYTIYDLNNYLDKVTVTVNYDIVSSNQLIGQSKTYFSKPFPNPSNDFININYALSHSTNNKIVINDILGNTLKTESLNFSSGLFQYDVQPLPKGIYFCSLVENEKVKQTYRFVVTK
ncbi:MAG: hypothetical protein A2W98_08585 [Bacteroidetes bacterium GWF2_33_38]|nr:MAG: hypothetical protein A2W98_08585 [Bacteroidetes bacterium GWF2_33_38]OFY74103.1 MAG: hypothetical protein A2265_10200 [Bacteroidetes bacterium RIFOXYA12_FULL_33_9]OFY90279.1 MAG: hypothetical protein A2236_04405 [Bacteroidetes bacterium RIFOXYA2_FULL_33_7]